MNIFQIPQSGQIFSSVVRSAIATNLGKSYVCRDTWRKMRRCADINSKRHIINHREVVMLWAIAQFWQTFGRFPTPLERNRFTNEVVLPTTDTNSMFATFGEHRYTGTEVKTIIENELGIVIKEDTLRKATEGVGISKTLHWAKRRTYTAQQVQRMIDLISRRPIAHRKAS